jgi:hypothetical protein
MSSIETLLENHGVRLSAVEKGHEKLSAKIDKLLYLALATLVSTLMGILAHLVISAGAAHAGH